MSKIYEQHQAAFDRVSAYVVLNKGERVATIAFKFPRDGAGRLYAYVHWIGIEMVRGHANGYGYDKKSAACESAVEKIAGTVPMSQATTLDEFCRALADIGGFSWERRLQDAGFDVIQAV